MNGKFSERTTPLIISAIRMACSSLSITHGPAIRNRSPAPTRTLSIWKDKVKVFQSRHLNGFVIPRGARDLHFAASLSITIYKKVSFPGHQSLNLGQRLIEIGKNIIDVLNPHRDTNHAIGDAD